tara:strand:+ start:13544 stop:13888 length:345 start_codon:yes stop_codon:yes gene_type:complete
MDRNKLYRKIAGREIIRRLKEVKSEYKIDSDLGKDYKSQILGAIDNLKFENTFVMAKIEKTGVVVRILSFSENVLFSDKKNWFLLNMQPHRKMGDIRWVSTNTRFTWVREFLWL